MNVKEIDKLLTKRGVKTIVLSDLLTFVDKPIEYLKKYKIEYVYNNYNEVFINSCFVTKEYIKHYENKYINRKEYNETVHKRVWDNLILIFVLVLFLDVLFGIVWWSVVIILGMLFNDAPLIVITSLIVMVFVFYYMIKLLRDLFTYLITEYAQFNKYL